MLKQAMREGWIEALASFRGSDPLALPRRGLLLLINPDDVVVGIPPARTAVWVTLDRRRAFRLNAEVEALIRSAPFALPRPVTDRVVELLAAAGRDEDPELTPERLRQLVARPWDTLRMMAVARLLVRDYFDPPREA